MFTPGIRVMINWYADWHLGRASYASAWLPYRQLARPRFNIQTRPGDCRSSRFTTVLWNNQHCSQRPHRYSISVTSYYPCLLMQWNISRPRRSRTRRSCPRPVPRWGTRAPCRRSRTSCHSDDSQRPHRCSISTSYYPCSGTYTDHAEAVRVDLVRDPSPGEVLGRHVDGRANDDVRHRRRLGLRARTGASYSVVAHLRAQPGVQQNVGTARNNCSGALHASPP